MTRRHFALSISTWFCAPEQGMKEFEILNRSSAFLVKSRPNKQVSYSYYNLK